MPSDFAQCVRDSSGPSTSTVLSATSAHPRYKPTSIHFILISLIKAKCVTSSPPPPCVSRTAENGSTAQLAGSVWSHVSESVSPSLQIETSGLNWSGLAKCLTRYINASMSWHDIFCPLSLETLPGLWPLCPAGPPMRASWRKRGLLQLWQPGAQTQSMPRQRRPQDQQVSSEGGHMVESVPIVCWLVLLYACFCVFGPAPTQASVGRQEWRQKSIPSPRHQAKS